MDVVRGRLRCPGGTVETLFPCLPTTDHGAVLASFPIQHPTVGGTLHVQHINQPQRNQQEKTQTDHCDRRINKWSAQQATTHP